MTAETVEQLINEIGKIKTQMNSTELQLYEANEKIAELIENVCETQNRKQLFRRFGDIYSINENSLIKLQHQHLKEENESLKVENSNLTKVAKLMTNSMKESMDTSKRYVKILLVFIVSFWSTEKSTVVKIDLTSHDGVAISYSGFEFN